MTTDNDEPSRRPSRSSGVRPGLPEPPAENPSVEDPSVEDLEEAMRDVVDPELGINVVDLGLVYGIQVDDGTRDHRHDPDLGGLPAHRRDRGPDPGRARRRRRFGRRYPDQLGVDAAVGPDKITDDGREQLRALGFRV